MEQRRITTVGICVLAMLGLVHVARGSFFAFDAGAAIVLLLVYRSYLRAWQQDAASASLVCAWLVAHTIGLYDIAVIGTIPWDRLMHALGGLALGMLVSRALAGRVPVAADKLLTVLVVLGIGAIHEIVEWLGYGYLGAGEGFLLYGDGDFGEWRNTVLDLIFNLVGVLGAISVRVPETGMPPRPAVRTGHAARNEKNRGSRRKQHA